ncbi:MAG TPA: hypothetical protein VM938_10580, partial [Acidimicrobiales bacterium]|nr:hypothetical protein [Acidimicrobiales bacterium]
PPFWAFKRFSFAKLTGQYDHVIGLMAAMARLNLLAMIGIEDAVMSETNVIGDTEAAKYRKGRNAVNYFAPGTQVTKMNDRVPFESFTQLDRLERQLRIVAGYPVTDDAQHPGGGWATGRGLQELTSAIDEEVREYHTILATGLMQLDALRLEWDETYYGNVDKTMEGAYGGAAFVETYTPSKHIKGHRRTRRVYGAMAGWDDATKIVGGLQLMQGGIIDDDTFRENLDGLGNLEKIKERILASKAEGVLFGSLMAMAEQGDPAAMAIAVEFLPAGKLRTKIEGVLAGLQEQQAAAEQQAAPPEVMTGQPPPDVATVLSRLTAGGAATGGVQTVGRI